MSRWKKIEKKEKDRIRGCSRECKELHETPHICDERMRKELQHVKDSCHSLPLALNELLDIQ